MDRAKLREIETIISTTC